MALSITGLSIRKTIQDIIFSINLSCHLFTNKSMSHKDIENDLWLTQKKQMNYDLRNEQKKSK